MPREMFLAKIVEGKAPSVSRVLAERPRSWPFPGGAAAISDTRHSAIGSAKVLLEEARMKREEIRTRCQLNQRQ